MQQKKVSHLWIMVGVLLVMWGLLLFRIDEQFFGHHESGFVWISAGIRVFKQFGPESVNFLPIRTPGPTTPETGLYYLHHPPLIFWFSAIATQLFGWYSDTLTPYESSLRMVGIIAAMLTLPLFYVLARRLTSARIALVGFFFYALTPVTVYFGRMPYYDMLVMPVILAFAYIFIRWIEAYTVKRTIILALLGVFAMWIAWAAAFYFAVFGVIALIYGKRQQRIGIVIIGAIIGLATIAIPILYALLNEETFRQLRDVLVLRTSSRRGNIDSGQFTLSEFTLQYINHMLTMLSISTTFFGTIGIALLLRRKKTLSVVMILGFIVAPLMFMLIARNSFNFHDWYKLHYLPGFAIASAIVIVGAWQLEADGIKRYAKPFVVAIVICSMVANVYWIILLHEQTNNDFARTAALELPQFTEEEDFIATSLTIRTNPIEFYAYRNIRWGVPVEEVLRFYAEESRVDLYYLLCLDSDTVNDYDGALSEYDYVVIADECRLIHLQKDETTS